MRPPEEVKRDLVRQWLAKAEEDFRVAEHLASENTLYWNAVGFHAQQAAEKFLKAVLVRHQIEFPKTHDVKKILKLLATVDTPLADSLRHATVLTPYGVEIRYPNEAPEVTPEAGQTAVALAGKVRDLVTRSLQAYLSKGSG